MTPQCAPDVAESASALVDGQLPAATAATALDWVCRTTEGRRHWQACHIIGEVLRSGQVSAPARDAEFLHGLQARLQREPLPAAASIASYSIAESPISMGVSEHIESKPEAANEALFRWRLIAGVTALGLVAVLGWHVSDDAGARLAGLRPAAQPVLALTAEPAAAVERGGALPPPRMLRDPQLDALLAAHKQASGTSALQMPSGFLRNATFDGTER
jgi:sigma-E factor negative regulatory protein RseA